MFKKSTKVVLPVERSSLIKTSIGNDCFGKSYNTFKYIIPNSYWSPNICSIKVFIQYQDNSSYSFSAQAMCSNGEYKL